MSERRAGVYFVYQALLALGSLLILPWVAVRLVVQPGFRRGLPRRLGFVARSGEDRPRVLLHGVSVGEVKALRPLVARLRAERPGHELLVSASTPSGLDTARQAFPDLRVVHFPLDYAGSARRFLERVRPTAVVLAELEIWPNFLRACARRAIPVAIVNGRITERSMAGYRKVQRLLPQFDRIALYCVQNERYAERFRALNVAPESVTVTGNLKYDALVRGDALPGPPWTTWLAGAPAVVLASTHDPEEARILEGWEQLEDAPACRMVVVPRHPRRASALAAQLRRALPERPVLLRSETDEGAALPETAILVVDTFGELESIYPAVDVAIVGGSLIPHGGQNVLEPAAFARPVLVGPHVDNFAEEVALLEEAGGLQKAPDLAVLLESARRWLENPGLARAAGDAGRAALDARRGATATTYAALARAGLF